ncbi:MAG: alpha/beta hydrolase [Solirubrobacterales bacterium]|nr:alpha/beta hydrolase [Solirubrobacterales bacterium]
MRHGYAELSSVRLHYVESGTGPLVVLLHGFPEFWFGWRAQIPALAAGGFRVVAPDLRGYNLSSRPRGHRAYAIDRLAGDVVELIAERGAPRAHIVGHDWGGAIAWATAISHPAAVARLAVLNLPHPRRLRRALRDPRQLRRSWYMLAFQLPWLPERLLAAGGWAPLRRSLTRDSAPGAFSTTDVGRYVDAWAQPGALTAMLDYYRAAMRARAGRPPLAPVQAPTLVVWGRHDRYLGADLARPDPADVPRLQRVVVLDCSHWVQHDEPAAVSRLLIDFFAEA